MGQGSKVRGSKKGVAASSPIFAIAICFWSLTLVCGQTSPTAEAGRHVQQGIRLHKAGDNDAAIREFETALKGSPDYADAHFRLGLVRVSKRENKRAIAEFKEVLRLKPDPQMLRQANWAITRLETPEGQKPQRRPIATPSVKNALAGWDKSMSPVKSLLHALQSYLDTDDYESSMRELEQVQKELRRLRSAPVYIARFEQLLSSPKVSERQDTLTALGDVISEVCCEEEWNFLGKKTLGAKIRLLARTEKDVSVRNVALQTLDKWEEGDWWWKTP